MKLAIKNSITRHIIAWLRMTKIVLPKRLKYLAKVILGRFKEDRKRKPSTIQLPITYKCNFDCVMCGMKTMIANKDFSLEEFDSILSDGLFSEIVSVGLNGGEPFIINNLLDYIDVLMKRLPKLKHIFLISNGFFTKKILEMSSEIKAKCRKKKIMYHLSISIDGVGEMQNKMRGNNLAFVRAIETCKKILENTEEYCDDFSTICTITKVNVYNLQELEAYTKKNNIPIVYNIATIHKRLNNDYKYEDFSVFTDERARQMASEFFYSKFLETKKELYFARYFFVENMERIAVCGHKSDVVTLTPDGNISYCATFSKELGDATKNSAYDLFFNKSNLLYRTKLHNEHCQGCSHYTESLNKKGYKLYFR